MALGNAPGPRLLRREDSAAGRAHTNRLSRFRLSLTGFRPPKALDELWNRNLPRVNQQKPGHRWPGEVKNYYEAPTASRFFVSDNSPRKRHAAVAVLAAVKIAVFCCRRTASQFAT